MRVIEYLINTATGDIVPAMKTSTPFSIRFWFCLAVVSFGLSGCVPREPGEEPPAEEAKEERAAGEFTAQALNREGEITLSGSEGQALLLVFWAPWSEACRHQIDVFEETLAELPADSLQMKGLIVDRRGDEAAAGALDELGVDFPVGRATDGILESYGPIRVVPTTFLIDSGGAIAKTYTGVVGADQIREDVTGLAR